MSKDSFFIIESATRLATYISGIFTI